MEANLQTLLNLRLLVGFLGERAQHSWWTTEFYVATSYSFLLPVFARTPDLARYSGVIEAARRLHDEHLNVGSYHLFRLPEEIEQDLRSIMQSEVGVGVAQLLTRGQEAATSRLQQLAAGTDHSGQGPILVGKISEIDSSRVLRTIASLYLTAFSQNVRIYPYLGG